MSLTESQRTEAMSLMAAVFDGSVTSAQMRRLDEWMAQDPEVRRLYLAYADLHVELSRRTQPAGAAPPARPIRPAWHRWAAIAASVCIGLVTAWWLSRPVDRPAAPGIGTLVWSSPKADIEGVNDEGRALPDQALAVRSGRATIKLSNGVTLLIEGPASLRLGKAPSACTLNRGRMVVHAGKDVERFVVDVPHGRVTDLGTTFAVEVDPTDAAQVHVIEGRVITEGREAGQELTLAAGQAAAITAGQAPQPIAGAPWRFATQTNEPERFELYSTGYRLGGRQVDPHWRVVSTEPAGIAPPPGPVTAVPGSRPTAESNRVRLTGTQVPDETRYVFETSFDLTGFDPATARIEGRLVADNRVVSIQLNQEHFEITGQTEHEFSRMTAFTLDRGFTKGRNRILVTVENSWGDGRSGPSAMHLKIDWKGLARRSP